MVMIFIPSLSLGFPDESGRRTELFGYHVAHCQRAPASRGTKQHAYPGCWEGDGEGIVECTHPLCHGSCCCQNKLHQPDKAHTGRQLQAVVA